MGFAWTPYAAPGLFFWAATWVLGGFVYLARPRTSLNRRLSIGLFLYGGAWGARYGLAPMATSLEDAYASMALFAAILLAMLPGYLLLAATLDTPLVDPLRSRPAQALLWFLVAAGPLWAILAPAAIIASVVPSSEPLIGPWFFVWGWGYRLALTLAASIFLFTLIAAISAARRAAAHSAERVRWAGFAVAFGTHDVLWGLHLAIGWFIILPSSEGITMDATYYFSGILFPLVFIGLLAYFAVHDRAFHPDSRTRYGAARVLLSGVFFGAIFVAAQLGQLVLQGAFGLVPAIVIVGVALVFLAPIERAARRYVVGEDVET